MAEARLQPDEVDELAHNVVFVDEKNLLVRTAKNHPTRMANDTVK